jgi:uncharacterized integral membrane protein
MADKPADTPRSRTEDPRQLLLGALIVLVVLFSLLNLGKVEVDLIFNSPKIPLILVIVACLAAGAAIDRLLIRRARHRGR